MRALPLVLLLSFAAAGADEGMWTFDNFPRDKVKQRYGFLPDDKWLEHVRLSSPRVGGCSASFISPQGLVLTNHHCARACIADLSKAEANYLDNGFYAARPEEEKRCPAGVVDQLVEIKDVTQRVNEASKGLTGEPFAAAVRAEKGRLEKECKVDDRTRCEVVTLYRGGLYHLYRFRRYDDVRLVFAPEQALGHFGGDPDNYEFPRWAMDMAFLRAYENGKPAATPHFLSWSRAARDGELVFIAGSPGPTQRLMTTAQRDILRDATLPGLLLYLAEMRGLLTEFGRRGAEFRRISEPRLLAVENLVKRYRGQLALLNDDGFIETAMTAERTVRQKVAANPDLAARAGTAWDEVAKAVTAYRTFLTPHVFLEGTGPFTPPRGFDSKLFEHARAIVRGAEERAKPNEQRLKEYQEAALPDLTRRLFSTAPIYDELEIETLGYSLGKLREALGPDDPTVKKVLGRDTPQEVAERVVRGAKLKDLETRKSLWAADAKGVVGANDPMIALAAAVDGEARALRKKYEETYEAVAERAGEQIARARFELFGTSDYPDATGTPRLSFGAIKGYANGGRKVEPFTTFAGIYARETGKDPFVLPPRWLAARKRIDMKVPFNAITTADTTGGNSGSPVINRAGELIGLNFDGNAYGTASSIGYQELQRSIFVHAAALLQALRVVYGADRLVKEIRAK